MRRQDREITDRAEVLKVLEACDTVHLGMNDQPYPYVVPLSFGWEEIDGQVVVYVHGAKEGRRHTLAAREPHVCIEASTFGGYVKKDHSLTCQYESVIGTGVVSVLSGEEAHHGLDVLAAHCGFGPADWSTAALPATSVWRITVAQLTGKRRVIG